MRVLIQRVKQASVTIENKLISSIQKGYLLLLGIEREDTLEDIEWLVGKIVKLRVFEDNHQAMNLSIKQVDGDIILVSQFTLYAKTKKGNRPSFIQAARPEQAIPLYKKFVQALEKELGKSIQTGSFGAMMEVKLINEGPVTIWIDSKQKE